MEIIVWIVEDDTFYRSTVAGLINEIEGMRCPHAFTTCEAAIAMLEEGEATDLPDIILMDIGLPGGMNGVDGTRLIKAIIPTTQIIMLTVHEDNDTIFEAICSGASGYLLKTVKAKRILDAIDEVRGGGAPMNAQIARRVLNMFTQLVTPAYDYDLTEREKQILELLVESSSKAQIAEKLYLSPYTVDTHIKNIYAKLHVHSRSDAVAKALRERLI